MDNKIKQLLYESFDRELSEQEQIILNVALADSDELQKEKDGIIRMRYKLGNQAAQRFSGSFVNKVMNEVQKLSKQREINELLENIYMLFKPVAIAATVLIIAMVSLNLLKSEQISLEGVIAVPEVTISDAYNPIINFNLE